MMNFLMSTPQAAAGMSDWREVAGNYFSEEDAERQKQHWEGVDTGVIDYVKHEAIARQRCENGKNFFV